MTKEEASRLFTANIRIFRHGYIVGGTNPHLVSTENREKFADELDRKFPDKAWDPVNGPWGVGDLA